ncbi:hypothetical protein HYPSUDRAFT_71930 [Hypholoma sublateritium FD-334 SS-4]|uniref:NAD(P)-binding protein n=1 Tax=Hypholoma sublateritium (strain FD-334 SS-4) TaxID=945553 RepID=A0A0D2LXH9_HYPSF|nr:hypothetical protein HYPSUDRAFT_71930 [Hypholoma sublateritium FD-334 SS-4]
MGLLYSLWTESFPPSSHFSAGDIPDLAGKVVIVTGANTGIGRATAKELLEHNAKVYIASRNADKAVEAIKELKTETGKDAIFLCLDLADLTSVKSAAEEFLGKEKELHILFNNAGVMFPPINQLTAQGYDLTFGTNVLGHFYFTELLIPALLAGAKSSPDKKARVVNTSSSMSLLARSIDFSTLSDGRARKKKGQTMLYCQSKLGNVLFANELARRFGDEGIISTSLNPGNINSELKRNLSRIEARLLELILYTPAYGAITQLWAGTSSEGIALNGKYLIPWARIGAGNKVGLDSVLAGELWKWLEEQVAKV